MLDVEDPLARGNFIRKISGSAGPGTWGDDTPKPKGMPDKRDCDHIATTYSELKRGLKDDNASTYYDNDIDLTYKDVIWAGDNVELVGQYCDPSVPGTGYKLHYDEQPVDGYTGCIRKESGTPPSFYGVYMDGPVTEFTDRDHTDPNFEDWLRAGVWVSTERNDGLAEFKGCRFSGWTWGGIVTGDHNRLTETNVKRCTITGNNWNHYGYGISQRDGDLWVDLCFFDDNRHHTAGYGHPTEYTDVTRCVAGPGPGASHAWDKHEDDFIDPGDQYRTAGGHFRMQNTTTMQTESIFGGPQEGVKLRGVTDQLSWIGKSQFYHEDPPSKTDPNQVQAIRQETHEWINFDIFGGDEWGGNNFYGPGEPPKGIGAPRMDEPNVEDETLKSLTVNGESETDVGGGDYEFVVNASVVNLTSTSEGTENISHLHDDWYQIEGSIIGGNDRFEVSEDIIIDRAWVTTPVTVTLDDSVVQLAPLMAKHIENRLEELEKETKGTRQWVKNKFDNLRIVFK